MSKAYQSALDISFEVPFGSSSARCTTGAPVFVFAILVHVCRVFFTGAFRRRELNWMVGVTLLLLAIANGFRLLDRRRPLVGHRSADRLLDRRSIPLVGAWAAFLSSAASFPADDMIPRMFIMHVLIVPAAIMATLGVHLALVWRQKHTQFAGRLQREDNVVGSRLWPTYAARSMALLFGMVAVIAALGGLIQINPMWQWGPFEPYAVTTGAQPDWYVGWLEGALRLFPPWEFTVFGHTIPAVFFLASSCPV